MAARLQDDDFLSRAKALAESIPHVNFYEGACSSTISLSRHHLSPTEYSIENIIKFSWVLHWHIYNGSSDISFNELDHHFEPVKLERCTLSTSLTLTDEFQNFSHSREQAPGTSSWKDKNEILLSHCDVGSNCQAPLTNGAQCKQRNPIILVKWNEDSARFAILYDQRRNERQAIVGQWHTFEKILQCIMKFPHSRICDVDFLSDHDRLQIIAWNTPVPEAPQRLSICSKISEHVLNRPHAPAAYAWDGKMTYAELDRQASQVASVLASHEVGPEVMVPFCIEKSIWALVSALAILKTGASLVPLDPDWPRSRKVAILDVTRASVVLCSRETRQYFKDMDPYSFVVQDELEALVSPKQKRLKGPTCTDAAFVLFSSGSTGSPKGMIREHGTAVTGSLAHAEAMHINENSRVLQFANHVFDVAMLDFFTTLIIGGCVCIPSESDRRNNLASFIEDSHANWVLLTPTVAGMLDPATVPSIRDMTLGGEAVSAALLEKWLPYCRVGINYGSAEVDVTHVRDVTDSRDPTNVGKRIKSCICFVVDPNNSKRILPVGAAGELLISAPTMAREYLAQPERTASSFISPPHQYYAHLDGLEKPWLNRAYRMGDLVQQQWDGSFRFIGRKDFQVKVHGQKVELGEIESHMLDHPMVCLCAVVYPRSGCFVDRLVIVIELHSAVQLNGGSNQEMDLNIVRDHLSQRVPSYMLPQVCMTAEKLPLTATLKVDRQKLLSWLVEEDIVSSSAGAIKNISNASNNPRLASDDEWGHKVSTLLADVLAKPQSQHWHSIKGHDTSFSQHGIDSIQIMRLSSLIKSRYGIKIPVEYLTNRTLTVSQLGIMLRDWSVEGESRRFQQMSVEKLREEIEEYVSKISPHPTRIIMSNAECAEVQKMNILLTGATGYLGAAIFDALLNYDQIGTINVLVRAKDEREAKEKLTRGAEFSAKLDGSSFDRITIWLGDLSQPQLGMSSDKWQRLMCDKGELDRLHCVVHCGAVVDWTRSYEELKSANVSSTVELINAALQDGRPLRFIYISGGQYLSPNTGTSQDETHQLFSDAAASNGYAQTKFVSEQVVNALRPRLPQTSDSFLQSHIVKPAYLIGSTYDGRANKGDYLWRVVAAAVREGCYNSDEDDQWLLVSDVATVADKILETTGLRQASASKGDRVVKILHGLPVQEFWSIVMAATGRKLVGIPGVRWLNKVRATMDQNKEHILWPLLDVVECSNGLLTNQRFPVSGQQDTLTTKHISEAIYENVCHLVETGYFDVSSGPMSSR